MTGMLNFEELKILVVEDNKPMQVLIKSILNAIRIKNIHVCQDGTEAFKEIGAMKPDIVITDFEMQPQNGLDFTRRLRNVETSPDPYLPVILLTSHTEQHRVIEARDAGVNEVLAKPISIKTLYERIAAIVERPRSFVRAEGFFGPDRRRQAKPYDGPERRSAERADDDAAARPGEGDAREESGAETSAEMEAETKAATGEPEAAAS